MKPPKLRPGESSKSFKARVKAWEKATGKKFPRTFSGKTDEERVLDGAVRIGLDKKKDYSTNYGDEIKEAQSEKARVTQASKSDRQVKDEKKESFLEQAGKTDYSKVPLPKQKLQVKNSPQKPSPEWGVNKENKEKKKVEKSNNSRMKMHAIERKNREIHGDKAVNRLKTKHKEWKKARKEGKLDEWKKKWKKK